MRQSANASSVAGAVGMAGAGKTTVEERLAERLNWEFIEGDRLHPPENEKMQSGQPLTDINRVPWLGAIAQAINAWQARNACGVSTCSALKWAYWRRITDERIGVRPGFFDGLRELIAQRLAARRGHFMPPGTDENPISVMIDQPVDRIVEHIAAQLRAGPELPRRVASTG